VAKTAYKSKRRRVTQRIMDERMETWTGDHHPCRDEVCDEADRTFCGMKCPAKDVWCKKQGYYLTGLQVNIGDDY